MTSPNAPSKEEINRIFTPITVTIKKTSKESYLQYSADFGQDAYMFLNLDRKNYALYKLRGNLVKLSTLNTRYGLRTNTLAHVLNLNILRKERLYTKLKYSRSPAYDIVSGGSAALLAGFLGFLISEKFGFELVDSGDFYYGFMYVVFLAFSFKPLALVADNRKGLPSTLSLRRVIVFIQSLVLLILKFV
jgi:hypothetical protein